MTLPHPSYIIRAVVSLAPAIRPFLTPQTLAILLMTEILLNE